MDKSSNKKNLKKQPVEKHNTAAWADADKKQPVSNVAIPSEAQVINAKEWVDTNEK
ncbi:MAG: DUF3787 domain-containing protein [Clostridiaceae bacterium]